MRKTGALILGTAFMAFPAAATETTTYTYDPLGRLTRTVSSGGVNSGLDIATSYDKADNRTAHSVDSPSAAAAPGPGGVTSLAADSPLADTSSENSAETPQ